MAFQFRMILDIFQTCIPVLLLLCSFSTSCGGNCTLTDGSMRPALSVWTNKRGCKCQCVGLDQIYFEHCRDCPARPSSMRAAILHTRNTCKYNGFDYLVNETWMSVETECTECRCNAGGRSICVSEKHCSNTCPQGQIPTYGLCCEVKECVGKVNAPLESISCWDDRRNEMIPHGRTAVKIQTCVDKFCICYNGIWKCHNFCKILNKPSRQRNKLCCPRPTADDSCSEGKLTFLSGETVVFNQTNQNCTCLNGRFFCNDNSSRFGTSFSLQNPVILYVLISAILTILCCLTIIVIYSLLQARKLKARQKENDFKMMLLNDASSELPESRTQTGHI